MRILSLIIAAACLHAAPENDLVGSKVCAGCHAEIAKEYSATGMARTSSLVGESSFRERFNDVVDAPIGAKYRISPKYRLDFNRPATGASGTLELKYAIGSGAVGRSYVTSIEGFLFQAPISYFSAASRWDLSPGFAGRTSVDIARPIEEPCLQCHATGPRLIAGTQNKYADPPFLEAGVGCERCHGPGRAHIEAIRSNATDRAIINPAKLNAARRDSVCLQCHLTGAAKVARYGTSAFAYQPGQRLSDHLAVFVWSAPNAVPRAATDHAEQLSASKCRQASGDRLWCGSCHDAHSEPPVSERAAVYRKACLTCHQPSDCKEAPKVRAASNDDCRTCHMPKAPSREGEHVAFTLHTIPKRPSQARAEKGELKPFFPETANDRDIALAYAALSLEDPALGPRALALLEKAARTNKPDDAVLLAQLAQFYERVTAEGSRRSLPSSPGHRPLASHRRGQPGDLRHARRRHEASDEAVAGRVNRYPSLIGPGLNLAIAQLNAGNTSASEVTLLRILRFHPDVVAARKLGPHPLSTGCAFDTNGT